jgi:hypothetical protein
MGVKIEAAYSQRPIEAAKNIPLASRKSEEDDRFYTLQTLSIRSNAWINSRFQDFATALK